MKRALTIWRAMLEIGSAAMAAWLCFVASRLAEPWSWSVAERLEDRAYNGLEFGERAARRAGIRLTGTRYESLPAARQIDLADAVATARDAVAARTSVTARVLTGAGHTAATGWRDGVHRHAVAPLVRRVALTSVVLAVALAAATAAVAWWTSTATISGNLVSTGSWADCASLDPGTSTAVHWYVGRKRVFYHVLPIANVDSAGAISLDFGDVPPRNANASPDVFRVAAACQRTLTVAFSVEGAVAGLIQSVRFAEDATLTVAPGQTRSVYVKLDVPKTAVGEYRGTLVVAVEGTTERHELPVLITVKTPPRGAVWTLLGAATPTPTPSGALEPLASASPSPSAVPSASPWPSSPPELALQVQPGPATAQILDPSTGMAIGENPVAVFAADGTFSLDLGGVRAGGSHSFDGALVLTPSGPADVPLAFLAEGDTADLGVEVALLGRPDHVLPAGVSTAVRLAVTVPADAAAGMHAGVLVITSGEAILLRIPFAISVWTAAGTASASPATSTSVSASPLPSPSGSAD